MPSQPIEGAFIKLYLLDGAPWKWPCWQEISGILHGLFPEDDANLPEGWSCQDADDVLSYFRAFQRVEGEEPRNRFVVGRGYPKHPGRLFWKQWIKKQWGAWGLHTVIVTELKDADIHPHAILIRENDPNLAWPSANDYIAIVLDSLGLKLFGEEAFPAGADVLRTDHRNCMKIFVIKSWTDIRYQINGLKQRAARQEALALSSFQDLGENKPTKLLINRAIRNVAKWKEIAELLATPHNAKKADDMMNEIQAILVEMGAAITSSKPVQRKGLCKVSTQALRDLATQEDVTDLLNTYNEYFDTNIEDEVEMPIPDAPRSADGINDTEGDFGMEVEATLSPQALSQRLGFKGGLVPSFNQYCHRSGISPWEDEEAFKFPPDDFMPVHLDDLKLHWHQVAGIHSIIRSVFTPDKAEGQTGGVLVGDEVGLGKTAQSIGVIAFLNSLIYLQEHERLLPAIIDERPFLRGNTKVPSLPHLILCPGTLVAQWVSELKILFTHHSVDIFVYDSQVNGKVFWGPEGPLHSSLHKPHHRIVVASQSAVFNEFKKLHMPPRRGKSARPWMIPGPKQNGPLGDTIFAQRFLTAVVDEAHHMRNPGNKHLATLRLLEQATVRLIMTATPLHTAAKDIASLARLVGIPHFFHEASHEEDKEDASRLRKAKRILDDGEAVLAEKLRVVRRLQSHVKGHFLRRTTASIDYSGQTLLDLPPYEEIIGLVKLTDRETEIIAERAEAAKAALMNVSDSRIQTKKFYLEYRLAVGYAKEDAGSLFPSFKLLDDWRPVKSTKMDVCARICAHYLRDDRVDDVTFDGGQPVFPDLDDTFKTSPERNRRIIIYAEFPSMAPLLQNVLSLYGVPSLAINGKISFAERDKRVKELHSNKHPSRVLIFSSVGSAGLNLAIADVVIFFDQPWSAQDERQIRGWAHRQPQDKVVKVISLLAIDSADTLMYEVARGKENMFEAFVNKGLRDELHGLLQGRIPDGEEAEEQDLVPPPPKKTRRRKKVIPDDDDEPPNKPQTASEPQASEPHSASEPEDASIQLSDGDGVSDKPPSISSDGASPLLEWPSDEDALDNNETNSQRNEDPGDIPASAARVLMVQNIPMNVPVGAAQPRAENYHGQPSPRETKCPRKGTVDSTTRAAILKQSQSQVSPSGIPNDQTNQLPPSLDQTAFGQEMPSQAPQCPSSAKSPSISQGQGLQPQVPDVPQTQRKPNPFARRPRTAPQISEQSGPDTGIAPSPTARVHPLARPRTVSSSLSAMNAARREYDRQTQAATLSNHHASTPLTSDSTPRPSGGIPGRSALVGQRSAKPRPTPRT